MTNEYPASYILRVKVLDSIIVLCALAILAIPAIHRFYPGDIDTTVHVALGALLFVCSLFRVLVAWGSAWLEIVIFFLGLLIFQLPTMMHMRYDDHYRILHMGIGGLVMVLAVIGAIQTFSQLRRARAAK